MFRTTIAGVWARDPARRAKVLELAPRNNPGWIGIYTRGDDRRLHLIQAFVAEQEGDTELRDRHLEQAHPAFEGEHEPYLRCWPELREFCERHPLEVVADERLVSTSLPGARLLRDSE
jgi:hypothetical protein